MRKHLPMGRYVAQESTFRPIGPKMEAESA
jgi:hypothetical protein